MITSGALPPRSGMLGSCMMIVEKFGQLFAQTLVALALVAEHDRAFEQQVLKIVRQMAPKLRRGRSKDGMIAVLPVAGLRVVAGKSGVRLTHESLLPKRAFSKPAQSLVCRGYRYQNGPVGSRFLPGKLRTEDGETVLALKHERDRYLHGAKRDHWYRGRRMPLRRHLGAGRATIERCRHRHDRHLGVFQRRS